jgi:hypothetical protein
MASVPVTAVLAGALVIVAGSPAAAEPEPTFSEQVLKVGSYSSAPQLVGTSTQELEDKWDMRWFGGEDGTVSWPTDHPRGRMRFGWTKYRIVDADPSADYYLMDVWSEWRMTGGLQWHDAYMFHQIHSSVTSPGSDVAATPTHTSNKSCFDQLQVGINVGIAAIGWTPRICNGHKVTLSALTGNSAHWYSDRAGGLNMVQTGFYQKVPQGVVPQYSVNIGIPQYTATWNGQWWVVNSHIAWTQGWDPGADAGRTFGPTRFANVDGGRDEIVSIWPNGDVYAYPNQGWSGTTYSGDNNKRVAQGFNKDQTMFGDIDGDGLDEIIAVWPNGEVHAYRNQGWSGTTYSGTNQKLVAQGFTASHTQFADLNGDGRDELISIFPNGDVHAYLNQGWSGTTYSGTSQKLVAQGFRDPTRTKFADLNADGRDEIISIFENGEVHAYLNQGWSGTTYSGTNQKLVAQGFKKPFATFFGNIDGAGGEELISIFDNGDVHAYRNRGWNATSVYTGADQKLVAQGFGS